MPTGYTAKIKDGISFNEFALTCARAFGACIEMRDDPMDATIPEEFKPSLWHLEQLAKTEKELAEVKGLTPAECDGKAWAKYQEELDRKEDGIREGLALHEKYAEMLRSVNVWIPPTANHAEFKNFMIQQLEDSDRFDSNTEYYQNKKIERLSGETWRLEKISELLRNIAYHREEHQREIDRANERTLWVKALRDSLKK